MQKKKSYQIHIFIIGILQVVKAINMVIDNRHSN